MNSPIPVASSPLLRAESRLHTALSILADLDLLQRWSAFGKAIVVGAVAYNLVVAPDIDIEVYCDEPCIEHGFSVLQECACHAQVTKAVFARSWYSQNAGLYWQLKYLHQDGTTWNIDMWSLAHDSPRIRAVDWIEPIKQALTDETRLAILEIKESAQRDASMSHTSMEIYRAVFYAGVRSFEQFREWLDQPDRENHL